MKSAINLDRKQILESKANHAGLKRLTHPKMLPYMDGLVGHFHRKFYLFNFDKMVLKLTELKDKLTEIDQNDKKILFIATKTTLRGTLSKIIAKTNHFFVDNRWLGGMLTNFENIQKRILLLQEMYSDENKGLVKLWPKKERMQFQKKKQALEVNLLGILEMTELPDFVFLIDPKNQQIALKEAQKLDIPVLALLRGDNNPAYFEAFAPINVNTPKMLAIVLEELLTDFHPKNRNNKTSASEIN